MTKSLLAESMNILEDMLKTPGSLNLNPPHREPDMPDISKVNLDEGSLGYNKHYRLEKAFNKKIIKDKNGINRTAPNKSLNTALKYNFLLADHGRKIRLKNKFRGKDHLAAKAKEKANESKKLQKLYNLINEAQKLIDELTASGSIGVNMAGPVDNGVKFPVVYKKDKKRHKKLINWLMQANGQKY